MTDTQPPTRETGPSPDYTSERGEKAAPERADVLGGAASSGGPGSFDDHHPPAQELLDDCVHCGFCLPTCPTYALWGEEMDSPRGRIYLMQMAENGEIPLEGAFTTHIDRCLGCMACVTACPSGVQYDRLLEATRPQIERNVSRSRSDRLFREAIFTLFPYRRRLRAASLGGALYQKLRPKSMDRLLARLPRRLERLVAMESLLPPVSVRDAFARTPALTPAVCTPTHPKRGRVGMLVGCVQDVFFHQVNLATVRVLAAEGYDVVAPREQGCCGALGLHAGREEESIERAKALIAVFERAGVDVIAVNVAGCGSSMKEYGELLADDPAWADRAAALLGEGPRRLRGARGRPRGLPGAAAPGRRDRGLPRRVPPRARPEDPGRSHGRSCARSRAWTLAELPEAEICCGSAGIYNMLQPEAAGDLGRRKADNIRGTGADVLVTANPGCLLQIRKYLEGELPMLHPVQLIDASIRGVRPPGM